MSFGRLGSMGRGFGRFGAGGHGTPVDPLAPGAPTTPDLQSGSDLGASATDNNTSDTTPTFDVTLPSGFLDVRDAIVGDVLYLQISDNAGFTSDTPDTLDAGDVAGLVVAVTPTALAPSALFARARLSRTISAVEHFSPYSAVLPFTVDTTAPTLSSTTPADNATGVDATANLTATFSKNVVFGTGNFTIKKTSDNTTVEAFDVATEVGTGNGQISVLGNIVTLNPTAVLPGEELYVLIDATAIDDVAGNSYAGIASTTAWSFTPSDVTAPTITLLSPLDDATGVALSGNMIATFSENVSFNSVVSILLKKTSDNSTVQTFTEADIAGAISISGAVLTINPTSDLANATGYYVQIGATSIKDGAGNFFAGISNTTTWNFTALSANIAFIDAKSAGFTSASSGCTTAAMDTTGATLLIAAVERDSGGTLPVFIDSKGNIWNAQSSPLTENVSGAPRVRFYYSIPSSIGSGHTFTLTGVNLFGSINVAAFSGTHTTPFDGMQSTVSGTSASPQAGSITPSADNEVVIAAVGVSDVSKTINSINGGLTIASTLAGVGSQHYGLSVAYLIQTTAAAANPTWTLSGSSSVGAIIAAFKRAP